MLFPFYIMIIIINILSILRDFGWYLLLLETSTCFRHKMRDSVCTRDNGGGWCTLRHVLSSTWLQARKLA